MKVSLTSYTIFFSEKLNQDVSSSNSRRRRRDVIQYIEDFILFGLHLHAHWDNVYDSTTNVRFLINP